MGESIGRYTVVGTLGQGGMGKVYLADDPIIGRQVAIKVITVGPDLSEEEARQYGERFLREAQAAGALHHPNIVAVHDVGQDPATGSPYIVMEHVSGWDLKKVIRARAPLSPVEATRIVVRIARALDFAHGQGIVHRDIKPANVLFSESGEVKITDFGVARLPGSDLTRSDQFVGSPGFMSPEQLKGTPADGRSDLFALGVILYQLLTGRAPFGGENVSEVLYKISTQPADPPSEANPDVPADFDPIIEKVLSKDPDSRYQSATEMIAALEAICGETDPEPMEPIPAMGEAETAPAAAATTSPWWTLTSQWRLGVILMVFVMAVVGINVGVQALLRGPFGRVTGEAERDALLRVRSAGGSAAGPLGVVGPAGSHAAGQASSVTPARGRQSGAPGTSSPGQAAPQPGARLRLELKHRLSSGRIVVLLDGKTVLSKPFEASGRKPRTLSHVLSIPAGRHGVEVRLLRDRGAVAAKSKITGTLERDRTAVLKAEQPSGSSDTLKLAWAQKASL
jgi:hypothetical protein